MYQQTQAPDMVPVLSRGKHRNPRKGACFMEFASYLAGERWSDHPACTHPLLAALARLVNDYTSDAGRPGLAHLVPSVIGLTSDDLRVDAGIALRCATTALPVTSFERQRVMAVSILTSERILAELDDRPGDELTEQSRRALRKVPHADQWARRFVRRVHASPKHFRRHAAPTTVQYAVDGIAHACVADPDRMLHDLLEGAIADVRQWVRRDTVSTAQIDAASWATACEITGTVPARR